MAGVKGVEEFEEFAENIDDIDVEAVIDRAEEETAKDLRRILVDIISDKETRKGGKLDSRTSPYSPGTKNDSSTDNIHISDTAAWDIRDDGDRTVLYPRKEVEDRAKFLDKGTRDHGPRGDTPMHYYFKGVHIVVADEPDPSEGFRRKAYVQQRALAEDEEEEALALLNYGEPNQVEGVEAQNFFLQAANEARSREVFTDNLGRQLELEIQEAFA